MNWEDEALCRGRDPALWYEPSCWPYAVMVCRRCPVRCQCLADATSRHETYGVWGGRTPGERNGTGLPISVAAQNERHRALIEIRRGASTVSELMDRLGTSRDQTRAYVHRLEQEGTVRVSRPGNGLLRFSARWVNG